MVFKVLKRQGKPPQKQQVRWSPFCIAFAPLFPKGNWPFSGTGKPPPSLTPFCGKSYYFYRISCVTPLFSPTRKLGAEGDAKWWPSIGACLILSGQKGTKKVTETSEKVATLFMEFAIRCFAAKDLNRRRGQMQEGNQNSQYLRDIL